MTSVTSTCLPFSINACHPHLCHPHLCSHHFATMVSHPSLVFKAQLRSGETIVVDDYLESYHWLNKNTPDDARVLSW